MVLQEKLSCRAYNTTFAHVDHFYFIFKLEDFLQALLNSGFRLNFKIIPETYILKITKFGIIHTFITGFEI